MGGRGCMVTDCSYIESPRVASGMDRLTWAGIAVLLLFFVLILIELWK